MPDFVTITLVVFLAIFTQTLTGFGLALISMPLLSQLLGIDVAAPLVALIAIVAELILLVRYREDLSIHTVWRLSAASLLGIPVGIWAVRQFDDELVLAILGIVIIGYALYALLNFRLPKIEPPEWAYGFGFMAGILSGAYNTAGPAVVIYGNCQRWEPRTFKSNLQGFFLLNSMTVIATHLLSHHYNADVWHNFLLALPALGLGLVAGFALDHTINPLVFRKMVLVLLILIGLRLVSGIIF